MSKHDDFLNFLINNVGKWSCSVCGTGSNQPASTFREVKNLGYKFEEVSPNRWGKTMYCKKCGIKRTHYRLLSAKPEFPEQKRNGIDAKSRERIIALLGTRDAFTGATIKSTPEIDHKIPFIRLSEDYDVTKMSDEEIKESFQMLTREHNLLKDRMCKKCKLSDIRQPFLGISFWYEGDENYTGSCIGCGWYDGEKWRSAVNEIISKK